eukprot:1877152-Lingulodinium_polyedra.AAC.1
MAPTPLASARGVDPGAGAYASVGAAPSASPGGVLSIPGGREERSVAVGRVGLLAGPLFTASGAAAPPR